MGYGGTQGAQTRRQGRGLQRHSHVPLRQTDCDGTLDAQLPLAVVSPADHPSPVQQRARMERPSSDADRVVALCVCVRARVYMRSCELGRVVRDMFAALLLFMSYQSKAQLR